MSPFPVLISSNLLAFLAPQYCKAWLQQKESYAKLRRDAVLLYPTRKIFVLPVERIYFSSYFVTNIGNVSITFRPLI